MTAYGAKVDAREMSNGVFMSARPGLQTEPGSSVPNNYDGISDAGNDQN